MTLATYPSSVRVDVFAFPSGAAHVHSPFCVDAIYDDPYEKWSCLVFEGESLAEEVAISYRAFTADDPLEVIIAPCLQETP